MNGTRLTGATRATFLALVLAGGMPAAGNELGVAVIVGNKEYADERVPEVSYAHNDAEAFKRFVTGRLGFDLDNVIDLRDATKSQLETAFGVKGNAEGLVWRYVDPSGGSDVVVFYSGHGVPGKAGRGYLLPVDSNPDTAELNGYPIDLLYENLGDLPTRSTTVFLDACFSGGSPRGMLIQSASPVYVEADVSGGADMTVLTAASGAQLASWDEGARHGLFTEHLLDGLYGAADADGDGQVTAREAKLHLDRTMTRAARREFGRVQDAGLHGDESAVLSFSPSDGWGSRPLLGAPPAAFTVLVEPAEARIRLLDHAEPYRAGVLLPPGSYRVEASAEGYEMAMEAVLHGASPTVHAMALRKVGPKVGDRFRDCPECPEMVVVPAGSYRMGSPPYEQGRQENGGQHVEVTSIPGRTAEASFDGNVVRIENFRLTNRSQRGTGSLYVSVRATTGSESTSSGYHLFDVNDHPNWRGLADLRRLGGIDDSRLSPGASFDIYRLPRQLRRPPDGAYYVHVVVYEWNESLPDNGARTQIGSVTMSSRWTFRANGGGTMARCME